MWAFAVQKELDSLQNGSFFYSILSVISSDFQPTEKQYLEQTIVSNPLWHRKEAMSMGQTNNIKEKATYVGDHVVNPTSLFVADACGVKWL